jgi:ATP/ADP translocase
MFLMIDEFAKVINFAIAKPVRENLWRGLSAEARYEAKPIVDTLANRWGGGSAAFLVSFINGVTDLTGLLVVNEKTGEQSIFGFPPVLLLCMIISAWWLAVTFDVGNIRRRIDLELKKQQ